MNDNLSQRRSVLQQVLTSPYSSFYRDLYARRDSIIEPEHITDESRWESLPLLTKDDLVNTPFRDRLYVPYEEAGSVRLTSGTSNRGILLFPRNEPSYRPDMEGTCTRMLMMYFPLSPLDDWGREVGISGITGVPGNIPASARMARAFQVNGLAGPINGLLALLQELSFDYDTGHIKYIMLQGGFASPAQFAELEALCPNARCTWEYASIEGNGRLGIACLDLENVRDNHVHFLTERCYAEIVDRDTSRPIHDHDVEGELVITTIWETNPLPVIRYRTGDLAVRSGRTCSCPHSHHGLFQIRGRAQFDRANIPGGQLQSHELERVLFPFRHEIHSDFELHVHESAGAAPRLILHIRPRRTDCDTDAIRKSVERDLRISATDTLLASISKGRIQSLQCVIITNPPDTRRRPTRIKVLHA